MRAIAGWVGPLLVAGALFSPARAEAQDKDKPFTFTSVDLKMLEDSDLFDQTLEKDGLVYSDAGLTDYVTRVGLEVVGDGPVPEHVTWRFRVIRDALPNAFALANGSIYVHSGLLALLQNEDQLASVLAHESTHVLARHGYLEYRGYRKKSTFATILGSAAMAGSSAGGWGGAIAGAAGGFGQVLVMSTVDGYGRELEADADKLGLLRLRAAGFDAAEMAAAFRLLQTTSDLEADPIYYTDHPKLEVRIAYVTKLAAESPAGPTSGEPAADRAARFVSSVQHPARDTVQQAIDARRFRTAVACAQRLVNANPDSTEMRFLLGEAYRALGPRTASPAPTELDSSGRRKAENTRTKLTPAEQEKQLLALPEGQAAWRDNQKQSEEQYQKALALDGTNFKAYRGLGLLYEKAGRTADALAAFRKYLELALDPPDRARIQRHIDALEKPTTNPG